MKHLLLTVSVLTLLSAPSFATWQQDVKDQVSLEVGKSRIIQKLMKSQDYTIDLDEGALVNTITDVVKIKNKDNKVQNKNLKPEDITFETRHQILNTLDGLKNSHASLGYGYYLTKNFRGNALCVESVYNPLVYAIKSSDREQPDGFLPVTYKSNFMSQKLCDEIDYYTSNNGLSKDEAKRLNRYLQPIFYIIQQEVSQMLDGKKSLLYTQRWVYGKDYSGIVKSVKEQTEHHHALISKAGLKGFNPSVVEDSLVPSLVDLALSLIPHPSRILLSAGDRHYTLGVNKIGHLSLIHPDTNLPYPVLQAHRGRGDMNLPKGFKDSSALRKQWKRVGEFVRSNEDMSHQEKTKSIILLEPVGYLANEHFQTLRIDLSNELLIETLQKFMDEGILKNAPKDDFPYTLHRHFFRDENMMNSLHTLHQKVETHSAMIEDLYPQTMKSWEKTMLVHGTLGYLLHNEIIDRLSEKLKDRFDVFSNTLRQIKF